MYEGVIICEIIVLLLITELNKKIFSISGPHSNRVDITLQSKLSKENETFQLYAICLAFKDHGIHFMAGWVQSSLKFPLQVPKKLRRELWISFPFGMNSSSLQLPSAHSAFYFTSVHCWSECSQTSRG
jgi:hypothetical protein